MRHAFVLCAVLLTASACGSESSNPPEEKPRALKAVLFPYIPDSAGDNFASLKQRLEHDFEQLHSDIDLDIVFDLNLDVYDLSEGGTLNRLLGEGSEAAQVVEIDSLLLGELVSKGWIQPVPAEVGDAFPTARQAVSIQGKSYGTPTYLCTNVVYSVGPSIHSATDGDSLVHILSSLDTGKTPLVANYDGSWTLPAWYMDAWADTHPAEEVSKSLALPLDAPAMGEFKKVVDGCANAQNANPCLDGTYADNSLPEEAFAKGQANGFMGYTERLWVIRHANPNLPLPQVMSAPLGTGSHPVIFVDTLVLNAHCTGDCLEDAHDFSEFMSTPEVRSIIAFSQDAPQGTLPRYLLQASQSFYQQQPASVDPMYQQYAPIVSGARTYPTQGFPENRKTLQSAIQQGLQDGP
ncbi:hypothetical protein [Hyalangium versicolor]|uniref:hypothetical protein n=1 Tax=Hyalangium versicolor TaxID=2861190 RepID=UPI001CCE7DA5|nr:hypothetical protein [Hyalangium versicolor]